MMLQEDKTDAWLHNYQGALIVFTQLHFNLKFHSVQTAKLLT